MTMLLVRLFLVVCVVSVLMPLVAAADVVDYNQDIRPLLSDNCFACHGPDAMQRKAKLRLDTREGLLGEGRDGHRIIVPGQPEQSLLIERVASDDPSYVMPPAEHHKPLQPEQIALLKRWVTEGAVWSDHWAFLTPTAPELPKVSQPNWPRNPIDRFILARLDANNLQPSAPADKTTLIRRVTLDLTGLPPTPAEVADFVNDPASDAYERLVERLLNSPRYGEHMARYWLDLARYGDTHGLHLDNYREMYPYRSWVIRAFARNMPFDQFMTEQLAGDLLPSPSDDQQSLDKLIATGFLRSHVTTNEGGSIVEECYVRNVIDRVDTNGTVFLGLTVGCARCHDHKYDPISQQEYYQLFAFFNNLDGRPMDGNAKAHPPIVRLPSPAQEQRLATLDDQVAAIKQQLNATKKLFEQDADVAKAEVEWIGKQRASDKRKLPKPIEAIFRNDPDKWNATQKQQVHEHYLYQVHPTGSLALGGLRKHLQNQQQERKQIQSRITTTLVFRERKDPRPAYRLHRGEYDQRREQVPRRLPAFLPPLPTEAPLDRLGFARWLTDAKHPLTARVAVNRFWQQCFGVGLVKTSEDFGAQGEPPSHPKLLDYLAVRFIQNGWDVKALMRAMVCSSTYRQSARLTPQLRERDPENRLFARGPRFRLDAEMLRDQALFVSGLLVETIGGPSVKPPQPTGLWKAVGYSGSNTVRFQADHGPARVHRRSLYTFWKRTAPPPQMSTFDAPSRESCIVRRERTNTPLQALLLLNDPQYVEAARHLAARVLRESRIDPHARLTHLFRLVTSRAPTAGESAELQTAVDDLTEMYANDPSAAKALLAVGELPPDPAFDPHELAAWTIIASTVLNLDEVINKG